MSTIEGGCYEFVVAGALGPYLRSMLSELQVEERPRHDLLVLTDSDESSLLSLLVRIAGDDREVQAIRCVTKG